MSGKPTDFNDQARIQGADAVRRQLDADLSALAAARQTQNQQSAQPFEGEKQDSALAQDSPPPADTPQNAARSDDQWLELLERTKDYNLKASVRNTTLILSHDEQWLGVIGYCQLSYRIIKRKAPPMPHSEPGEWGDDDAAALRVWMSHRYGFTPAHSDINDALMVVARANRFHPIRDYLASLRWDGERRLETWLQHAFESTDPERYLELVGPKVLMGAVARVMDPGCKFDNVMILEGEQGRGKSSVIAALFGDWFSDSPLPIGDKEAYQLIQGIWGYELGELDSFNKAEVTALKQFFSQQKDRFRPSYGRYAQDFPRQTVFWGTTNQDTYLRDYTGNRRFWPVYCATVNKEWVRTHRDQLWAEALYLYETRHETRRTWWISQETDEDCEDFAIVVDVQDARLQRDPWEDKLAPYLAGCGREYLTSAEILEECIKLDAAHMTQAHMNRLAPILKSLGWRSVRKRIPIGPEKKQARVWVSEEKGRQLAEVPL